MRYAAFISYNHRDRKVASWLQRALETYRVPQRLRGRDSALGRLGARLAPIFQDREELAASSDLAASVQAALSDASSLIVICSPDGAKSRWVNEEIRAFTALGRRDRVQCLIVAGEPNASRTAGMDPELECLPPALFEDGGSEPLASDIRPGQDGRTAARLKLLAGVMGLPYDELRQREQQRRQRRLTIFAAAAGIGFAVMTALTVVAFLSRQEAIAQRDIARRKTLTAERTVDFVKSMFAVSDPSESRGATVTAREVLDRGAERIDRELATEPTVKAELGTTLGEVYTNLGLLRQGDALLRRGLATPSVEAGTRARQYLALGEARIAQADDAGAADALARALRLARDPRADRADLVPRILAGLGEAQGALDRPAEAEANIRRALALDRVGGPAASVAIARDLEALANVQFGKGNIADARRSFESALALRLARQGPLHPNVMQNLNQLGSVAYMQGDKAAAERFYRRGLPLSERVLGPTHPEVAATLNNLARVLVERRAYADALPLLRRAVAIQVKERGSGTEELAFPLATLGLALASTGQPEAAVATLARAQAIAARTGHRSLAPIMVDLAHLRCARGERTAGAALVAQARPIMAKTYPDDAWRGAWLHLVAAECTGTGTGVDENARIVLRKWPRATHYGHEVVRYWSSADHPL